MLKLKKVEELLFFLTILFLPTQLGRHFWPKFSFVYSLPIDYLSPTIYFWDLLVIMLVVFWVAQKKFVNKLALNLFLLFMLSQLLSLIPQTYDFNGEGLGAGLVRLEQYLIAGLMGVYIASSKFKIQNSKLYWPLLLAVLFESILAIAQFLKGGTLGLWFLGERTFSISTPAIAKFDFYGRQFLRPYATFPHPNVLAGFLVVILPLLSLIRVKSSGILMGFSTIIGGIALALTVSRVAMLVGFTEALILLRKKILVFLLLVTILVSPFLYTRFSAVFNFDNLTLLRREQLSEVAVKLWLGHPFLGVGLNNFIPTASDSLLVGPNRFLQPVHNIFLLALAETGILGLLGLLGLIGYPIFRLLKLPTTNYQLRTLLLIWAVIIFLGLFDHYFLTLPQGYRLLFLVWGLSLSMLELKNEV